MIFFLLYTEMSSSTRHPYKYFYFLFVFINPPPILTHHNLHSLGLSAFHSGTEEVGSEGAQIQRLHSPTN